MPNPNWAHLPAEHLILVGKIACQSAYLDLLTGEILGGLKGVKESERAKTIHVLDTRRKVQEAEALVKAKFTGQERTDLLDLLKRTGELLADRNLVLHAIVGYRKMELVDPVYIAFRGKYVGKDMPFSKETLEPIFDELVSTSKELEAQCGKRGYTEFVTSPEKPQPPAQV